MKRLSEAVGWGIFLLLAGVFLLLKNLNVFGTWGELAWAVIYTLAGLGFLIWFFAGTEHWWRAIPAFTLLGIGAGMLLEWRNIDLGGWSASLVLFGMALGFWADPHRPQGAMVGARAGRRADDRRGGVWAVGPA